MKYLRIEEDGSLSVVSGSDPENDDELLQEVNQGALDVVRFRGEEFQRLVVEEEGDEDDPAFDVAWETLEEHK